MLNLADRWAHLVQSHNHALIDFCAVQLVSFVSFWCFASAFVLVDVFCPNFSARHKLQAAGKQPTREEIVECLRVVGRNQLLSTFVGVGLYLSGRPSPYSFSPRLPGLGEIIRDVILCALIREVLFYYSHRLFHHRAIYAPIHKLHHRFTAPIALAAQYAHPVEHYVANVIPVALPPQLLRVHAVTWWIFLATQLMETSMVHSGYDFFAGVARMHDLHHESSRVNYGTVGLLDWLHGTWSSKSTRAEDDSLRKKD
ncbi:hypothetical protein AURDEDRAFT_114179 [Auricularia subglabra TFB-10046 SS5]|nr:hypothetical protein AURDEDRAFT_114179 [Auricularia subglabra TFB-10046 SS5]